MGRHKKKAKELSKLDGICWVDKNTFLVPSQTYQKKYVVKNEGLTWTCSCHDNYYRRRACKHINGIKLWFEKMPEYKHKTLAQPEHEILCPFCKSKKK